ncbi:DHA2 family efflux MFS transporter permease subunit [Amycolatopsis suaedae]|uniref:DHA2 family efflux MFS transporter permease subunit n=2 Tax=Amycolatopsis suaedae TaxID=2510978 RepID=A0A4Q7J5A2_9PSEU|nr:DHA2 family efflux MFS transporter permease subunit [Amycolatopsis suaedae]
MTKTRSPWAALLALCLGFFMILLDTTIVSIAIPAMLTELRAGLTAVVWVTSVYLLTYAVPMLLTGRLGDRFGPKRVFLAGLAVFTLASLWCGLAGSIEQLIAARAVQGLGAALMTPQTLAFITHLFPPDRRGQAMGAWGGVAGLATITGPLLGGVLVDHLGWEWIFFVNVPIGVLAVALTLWLVPDWQPRHAHRFDVPGVLLSAAGLGLLVFGIQNGQHYDWGPVLGPVTVPHLIIAGVVLLVVFVLRQRVAAEPLTPLRLFTNRTFAAGTFTSMTVGFAMTAMFIPLVVYLQSAKGLSPTMAGLVTTPMCLMQGLVAPFVGKLSDRLPARYPLVFGLLALAGGLAWTAVWAGAGTSPWTLMIPLVLCGVGIGSIFGPMSNATMGAAPRELTGSASGVYNTVRQVGGVLGSASVGVLLSASVTSSVAQRASEAAAALPAQERQPFVDAVAGSVSGGGEFGFDAAPHAALPPGTEGLVQQVLHSGLSDAAGVSILLPAGVLLAGVVAALFMRSPRVARGTAAAVGAPGHDLEAAAQRRG